MKFEAHERPGFGYSGPKKDDFLKIKDGGSIQGVFAGDPHQFYQHSFYPEKRMPVVCEDPSTCTLCAEGKKANFRFRINIIVKENGALVAKVFEHGWKTWKMLENMHSKFDLSRTAVDISKHGQGKETAYYIIPMPDGKVDDKMAEKLKAVKLVELESKVPTPKREQEPEMPSYLDEEVPIGDEPVMDNEDDLMF